MNDIFKKNLDKLGAKCTSCGKYFGVDHSEYKWDSPAQKYTAECGSAPYPDAYNRLYRNFTTLKIKGLWYKIKPNLLEKVLNFVEIDEGLNCSYLNWPRPIIVDRQVDIFTLAQRLGLEPPLNSMQKSRAKGKAFVEKIKGRKSRGWR